MDYAILHVMKVKCYDSHSIYLSLHVILHHNPPTPPPSLCTVHHHYHDLELVCENWGKNTCNIASYPPNHYVQYMCYSFLESRLVVILNCLSGKSCYTQHIRLLMLNHPYIKCIADLFKHGPF